MEAYREIHRNLSGSDLPNFQLNAKKEPECARFIMNNEIAQSLADRINNTRQSLKESNRAMQKICYNNTRFQFADIAPAPGMENYYNALMEVGSFSGSEESEQLSEASRKALDDLMEKIREDSGSRDSIYLDYRTYCKFDIDTISENSAGVRSKGSLSRWVGPGSQSEVMVPFYIILTAALAKEYSGSDRLTAYNLNDSDSLRIAIIDEAFNVVDTEKTRSLIKFMSEEMNLQLIMAFPEPMKDTIVPTCDALLLAQNNPSKQTRGIIPAVYFADSGEIVSR